MEDGGADAQMQKIQEEKSALRRQLIALVIMSFVISGMFYGITLLQNPYNKEWASWPAHKHTEMWMNVQENLEVTWWAASTQLYRKFRSSSCYFYSTLPIE